MTKKKAVKQKTQKTVPPDIRLRRQKTLLRTIEKGVDKDYAPRAWKAIQRLRVQCELAAQDAKTVPIPEPPRFSEAVLRLQCPECGAIEPELAEMDNLQTARKWSGYRCGECGYGYHWKDVGPLVTPIPVEGEDRQAGDGSLEELESRAGLCDENGKPWFTELDRVRAELVARLAWLETKIEKLDDASALQWERIRKLENPDDGAERFSRIMAELTTERARREAAEADLSLARKRVERGQKLAYDLGEMRERAERAERNEKAARSCLADLAERAALYTGK